MARRLSKHADPNPDALRTVNENGEAPKSRFRHASQVHLISRQMVEDNKKRFSKWERIYKAYKRFPPTEYSTLVELKMDGQSNVNWGLLSFIVNNNMTSFYDMVTERGVACDIQTKVGDPIERRVYSELISVGYDQFGLREDYNYLLGVEHDILQMLLYGKAIEMYNRREGYCSEPCPAEDFFVPEDTNISLDNFDCFMRRRKFRLHEIWNFIKNESEAKSMGWNCEAVLTAMRIARDDWKGNYTNQTLLKDIVAGRVALSGVMKERIHVYDMYVKEFDGNISRHMVLQDYMPLATLVNERLKKDSPVLTEDDVIDREGFLFSKMEYEKKENGLDPIRKIVSVFIDRSGSLDWHDTPSLAEDIFVQCRQYDIVMNSIMDAIKLNMTLMLQGQTPEATERLKAMIWGQFAVIPADTPFVQARTQMDTTVATQSLQFMMSDMYSGIGQYRVEQNAPKGGSPTATQRQLDAAESAKLSGTQVRRFNEQQTIHHTEKFRRFVSLTEGEEGYERFKKFEEEMREHSVPKKAYKWENIRSLTSNMIAGPGSPSYKLMAAEKIITLTNMTPKDDGQRAAIEDAIAAVSNRQSVSRYMPPKKRVDPSFEERFIGLECESFSDPMLNPRNIAAFPDDNHIQHISIHINDMAQTVEKLNGAIEKGTINEQIAFPAITRLMHEGAHVGAHLKFLQLDQSKEPVVKQFVADLHVLQRSVEKIQQQFAQIKESRKEEEQQFDAANDPDVQKKLALAQIEIDTAIKIANIKQSALATSHETKDQIVKDKASTEIAIARQKATAEPKQPKTLKPPKK